MSAMQGGGYPATYAVHGSPVAHNVRSRFVDSAPPPQQQQQQPSPYDELTEEEPVFAAGQRKERRRLDNEAKLKALIATAEQRKAAMAAGGGGGGGGAEGGAGGGRRKGVRDTIKSTDYLDYEVDFGRRIFNIVFGAMVLVALALLYVMWFTDWIR